MALYDKTHSITWGSFQEKFCRPISGRIFALGLKLLKKSVLIPIANDEGGGYTLVSPSQLSLIVQEVLVRSGKYASCVEPTIDHTKARALSKRIGKLMGGTNENCFGT